jgi:hypothetical protein
MEQIKCYCGHTTYCDCEPLEVSEEAKQRAANYMSLKGALEPKQETTLEEAAKSKAFEFSVDYKPWETSLDYREYAEYGFEKGFIAGAKWKEERMYSDMQEYAEFCIRCYEKGLPCIVAKDWFEQFKKK